MRAARLACQHLFRHMPAVPSPVERDIVFCRGCRGFQVVTHVYPFRVTRDRRIATMCGAVGSQTILLRGQDAIDYTRVVDLVCTEPEHAGGQHYDETYGLEFCPAARSAAA